MGTPGVDVNLDEYDQRKKTVTTSGGWLSSAAALALLRVRPQTLYANASRKRIRVRRDPDDPRRRLYHAGDVRRLASHRRGRPGSEQLAAEAVSWGSPILSSAISTVAAGRLWYRGRDALQLAEHATLEEVAALLWQCDAAPSLRGSGSDRLPIAAGTAFQAAYEVLAWQAGHAAPTYGRAMASLQDEAARLLAHVANGMLDAIGKQVLNGSLHSRLARAWGRPASADISPECACTV